MFSSVWNFVKRHKKKFIFVGVLSGGAYWGVQYAQRKFQEFQELEAAEYLEHAKRQHHFDSNQRTCNVTIMAMLPSIKLALMRELNSEEITEQLKSGPDNKLEIWQELKIISFTRTVSAIYCVSILIVFLRVQLNVIGGYMFTDSMHNKDGLSDYRPRITPDVQAQYLALVQYTCGQGIIDLIAAVKKEVQEYMTDLSLKEPMTILGVQTLINHIRHDMEMVGQEGASHPHRSLLTHLMMSQQQEENDVSNQHLLDRESSAVLEKMVQETRDLLESADFHTVLTTCIDTAFARVMDRISDYYKPVLNLNGKMSSSSPLSIPLAKLIPMVNSLIHTILADAPNPFVQDLLLKDQMKDFAANIYEAFSSPPSRGHGAV